MAWVDVNPEEVPDELQEKHDFSLGQTVRNFPQSALDLGKDIVEGTVYAAQNPAQVMQGIGDLTLGASQLLDEAAGRGDEVVGPDRTAVAQTVVDDIKNKYGTWNRFTRTLEEDPANTLLDLSAVMAPISPRLAGTALPLTGTARLAGLGANVASRLTPQPFIDDLYQSAMKFPTVAENRAELTRTGLDYGLTPDEKGVQKLADAQSELESELGALIDESVAANEKVPIGKVFRHLGDLRAKLAPPSINASENLNRIDKWLGQYQKDLIDSGKTLVTPRELQDLKIDLSEQINWNRAGAGKRAPLREQYYTTLRRGAKETIEDVIPEVQDVNRELGRLYELEPNLQRSAGRAGNLNIIGMDTAIKGGLGANIGDGANIPAAAVGTTAGILDRPVPKSRLAIGLDERKRQDLIGRYLYGKSGAPSTVELMTLMTSRLDEEEEEEGRLY